MLAASVMGSIWSSPVFAEPTTPRRAITIPAGTLRSALDALARQTGISIGMAGALPNLQVKRIDRGSDVAEILRQVLHGSALRAVRIDPTTWRIEPIPAEPARATVRTAPPTVTGGDIIVIASRRDERLSDLTSSISIEDGLTLDRSTRRRGLTDVMAATDSAFSTNLGPGRDRIFLRGVADSAFNGTSQSLVSLFLDDVRIGYASPDPDLRLVDVQRVEVLRGPQGTLYGTGALGGVVRTVTVPPDLERTSGDIGLDGVGVGNGGIGGAIEGTLNVPIVTGTLALRVSGWNETMPGWIDDTERHRSNVNRTHRVGGRAALRWRIGKGWTATLSGVAQRIDARDSQYATSGLTRATRIAEPQDNDFTSGALTLRGPLGKLDVQATTAYVDQEFGSTYDASIMAPSLGVSAPLAYVEDRSAQLLSQEIRLSDPTARHPWLIGATILHSTSRLQGRFVPVDGVGTVAARRDEEDVTDVALFAEGTQRLNAALDFKLGLRGFLTSSRLEQQGPDREDADQLGVTPSATLSWHRDDLGLVWLRYASAVRPVAISRTAAPDDARIPGDELQSLELGWRLRLAGDRVNVHGAVFGSTWEHLRSDTVGSDGLLGTVDAGNAVNFGVEFGGDYTMASTAIEFGGTLQRARLTSESSATNLDRADRRLPVVPDISGHVGVTRTLVLFRLPASVYATARYTGRTRLSFDPLLDRPAGRYATADVGGSITHGAARWSIDVTNLFDSRGNSFGFGNPFTLATTTQTVPVRPRAVMVGLRVGW